MLHIFTQVTLKKPYSYDPWVSLMYFNHTHLMLHYLRFLMVFQYYISYEGASFNRQKTSVKVGIICA